MLLTTFYAIMVLLTLVSLEKGKGREVSLFKKIIGYMMIKSLACDHKRQ